MILFLDARHPAYTRAVGGQAKATFHAGLVVGFGPFRCPDGALNIRHVQTIKSYALVKGMVGQDQRFHGAAPLIRIHLQGGDKRFLGDFDLAELAHPLLALLLLVEEFAFAAGVAAVALGGDVLS